MAGKGSVKLSIYSTFDDKGTKQAERAVKAFTKQYGEADKATGMLRIEETTRRLVEQSIQADRAAAKWAGYSSTLSSVGSKMTTGVTLPIAAAGAATMAAAIDIDTALTGVRKTVDGTEEQYEALKQAAIDFSQTNAVPASQILDIQALGAQLGFAIDELGEFGEVVSGLDIATNMDAEQAATEMAQFANITKMSHEEIRNYGSAIVGLGNNYATTESDISSMAMRIAAAGTQVHMSEADILGLATALSSMGVEAEAGGTAISTIMAQIDKDIALNAESVETWASTAGMSAQEFADAWKTDPVQALAALLSNMEAATAEGGNMSVMLEELGIDSIRQTDVMKRLAGNSQFVADAVATANDEWSKNTALQAEVDNRNQSLAARLEIVKNRAIAMAEQFGGPLADALLDSVEAAEPLIETLADGAQAFADMDEEQQRAIIGMVAAVAAMGPIVSVGGKVAGVVSSGYEAYGKATAGLAKFSAKSKGAAVAAKGLNAAMTGLARGTVAFATVAAVDGLSKLSYSLTDARKEALASVDALGSVGDGMTSFGDRVAAAQSTVSDMSATLASSGATVGELSSAIQGHEDAITAIIAGALAEQRALRDEELASIAEHNAEIERLEAEKVQAYQSGMQGLADAAAAEQEISADRAAQLLATAEDYHASSLADLDEYHGSRLQSLNQQYQVEGSLTEEEYRAAIQAENDYYNQSKANLDKSAADARSSVAEHAKAAAELSQDTLATLGEAREKFDGLLRGNFVLFEAYLNSDVGSVEEATQKMSDALASLATEGNSSFLALQLTAAEAGDEITAENAVMIDTLLAQFEDLPPEMGDAGDKAMRALARGLDDDLGIDVANATADEIVEAYRSKAGVAKGAGSDMSAAFASGFAANTQAALDAAAEVSGIAADQLAQLAGQAGLQGDSAVQAFADAIANGASIAEAAAAANASSATGGFGTGDGWTPGASQGGDFAGGVASMSGLTQAQAALVAQSGVMGLGSSDGSAPGSRMGGQFSGGVGSRSGESLTAGARLAQSADSGASSVDGSGAGDNFALGFIGAIGSWAQSAFNAAYSFVSSALAGGNAAQQSASPAKKTKEMAKWYALGYTGEMGDRERDAYSAGYRFASASLSGSEDASSAGFALPNVATRAQVTQGIASASQVGFDGLSAKDVRRAVSDGVAEALSRAKPAEAKYYVNIDGSAVPTREEVERETDRYVRKMIRIGDM